MSEIEVTPFFLVGSIAIRPPTLLSLFRVKAIENVPLELPLKLMVKSP